jgi:hypothetical protein
MFSLQPPRHIPTLPWSCQPPVRAASRVGRELAHSSDAEYFIRPQAFARQLLVGFDLLLWYREHEPVDIGHVNVLYSGTTASLPDGITR